MYRIGELAQHAGVTVRALHHYDELGLLTPSERSNGGHRLYRAADVERLYRLLALRSLGLPLEEIGPLLEAEDGAAATVRRHLARVDQQIGALTVLKGRLTRLLDGGHDTERLLEALEAMSMFEKYYTPTSLRSSKSGVNSSATTDQGGREQVEGPIRAAARVPRARAPTRRIRPCRSSPRRAGELMRMFTGGDSAIEAGLQRMYNTEGPERASRGMASPEDLEYLAKARLSRS